MNKSLTSLTLIEIAAKLKEGKTFRVGTRRERNKALNASKVLGIMISSRADDDGWKVYFLHDK